MKKKTEIITFKPKDVTKKLLAVLSDRAQDVVIKRYGLGKSTTPLTLEAIGSEYGITRERVRQIENFSLNAIRKSAEFADIGSAIKELQYLIQDYGGVVHEQEFLKYISADKSLQNHIHFLLVLSDVFYKIKENNEFHHLWTIDNNVAKKIQDSLRKISDKLSNKDLLLEQELIDLLLQEVKDIADLASIDNKILAQKWLRLSKTIDANPLGEWGLTKSPNIKMRGIRDYAYLVLRQHGSPMHFEEVAKNIGQLFNRNAHPATCHNELIKDKRFVLVGRGLYALTEWGYKPGIVIDVIRDIIKKDGALNREEIINKVLKERHVKENTILVNLQNPNYFKKDKEGRYTLL